MATTIRPSPGAVKAIERIKTRHSVATTSKAIEIAVEEYLPTLDALKASHGHIERLEAIIEQFQEHLLTAREAEAALETLAGWKPPADPDVDDWRGIS